MGRGINLSLTKSLAVFDTLLDRAIEAVSSKKLSVAHKVHKSRIKPANFEGIFDSIFSKKSPAEHGGADGPLSQDEINALLYGLSEGDLPATHELNDDNARKFRVGKYVKIDSDNKPTFFWIGYGWEENEKSESRLWLEFDAKTCPSKYWENLYKLVGTSGKYYSDIDLEFFQVYMNAWVYFYLREEYLKQFFDENADIESQREILTINEVVENCN